MILLPDANDKSRMAYSFRRGVRAMTVTSSTTAVALFANIFSPIMPIRAFGIFSGILIPVNFFLVVMMMPPAVVYYERKIEGKTFCCGIFDKKGVDKVEDLTAKKPA